MTSCHSSETQWPPDIEELCINRDKPKVQPQRRRRTMTLQDRELKHNTTPNNNNTSAIHGLHRSVSEMNVVAFCTCQQSKDFPFCDNTHTIFNKATNSKMAPLYVAFVDGDQCGDCGTNNNKERTRLTHSMDQATLTHKLNSITNNSHKLHNSANSIITTSNCCCKSKPLNIQSEETHTNTPTSIEKTDIITPTPISTPIPTPIPTISPSPSSSSLPSSSSSLSSLSSSPSTHIDTTSTTSDNELNDTCNTTKANTYVPSSAKSTENQNNIITRAEVAEHATQNDLWMIIKGNVYDITDYVQYHPGGVRALVKFAGQDGTDNVKYHSARMLEILNSQYFIGKLPKHEGGGGGGCTIS